MWPREVYQKNKTKPFLVIIPEEKTNQLIITTNTRIVDGIKRLISEIDREPKQYQIEAIITVIGADRKTIVSRPTIITLENQPATVSVGNADGTSIELQLTVREFPQPQQTSPSVKKATAGYNTPHPIPAASTTASYRLIPSALDVYRALSASYQPIHQPRRKKDSIQQTEREIEIQHVLKKKISLHFEKARFIDVIKHIAKSTGINVVLDHQGLKEKGLTADFTVSIDLDGIALKSALSHLLKPRLLAYTIEDEVLKITSKSRAQGPMITATYPVANLLVAPSTDYPAISSETLINLITSLIEPDSWVERGGQGVIHNFDSTRSLVIRQTDQGHKKIKKLLNSLREAKQNDSE